MLRIPLRPRALRWLAASALVVVLLPPTLASAQAQAPPEVIRVDASAPGRPFPHFWENIFGSGRASLALRSAYRRDLRNVKRITDFSFVRFHAILLDDMGVYDEDAQGRPIYNFSYVDQVYDGLLQNHVRPFVEISFMPRSWQHARRCTRSGTSRTWRRPKIGANGTTSSPPWCSIWSSGTGPTRWRSGISKCGMNPILTSWAGEPKQPTYFELYDHTARAIKRVNARLRIGGPATAQAAWVDVFIRHCAAQNVPLDFISTHVYGNDRAQDVFGTNENIPREQMVCRAVKKVHEQIQASSMPRLPLIWSEFNASYLTEPAVTDSVYMGPWLADTIRQCDGLVNEMSYWAFSDVFEEQGVVKQPFYGGYGLIAAGGIPSLRITPFGCCTSSVVSACR